MYFLSLGTSGLYSNVPRFFKIDEQLINTSLGLWSGEEKNFTDDGTTDDEREGSLKSQNFFLFNEFLTVGFRTNSVVMWQVQVPKCVSVLLFSFSAR